MATRPMVPADVARIVVAEELDAAGGTVVVGRRVIQRGRYVSHLYVAESSTALRWSTRRLTEGRVRDTSPRVAPDGSAVAFLRRQPDDDEAPATLNTVSIRNGRVRRCAPRGAQPGFGGIGEIAWSPDGRMLAFTADVDPPRFIVGQRPPVGSKAARSSKLPSPMARRIVRTDWRWDEEGHRDRWSHLFVLDLQAGALARQVTSGDWGVSGICWHPDGRTIAFVADRGADPDRSPRPAIWAVDVDVSPRSSRAKPRLLLDPAGGAGRPAYSPDGRWIAAVGLLEPDPLDDRSPELLVGPTRPRRGAGVRSLSAALDRPIGNWADTDLNGWMVSGRTGPIWLDATTIVAVVTDRGRSLPCRWAIDSRSGDLVDGPPEPGEPWADATTHAIAHDGAGRVFALGTIGGRAMELMSVDVAVLGSDSSAGAPTRPEWRTHTRLGSSWQREFVQPHMECIDVPGPAGPIETWIASPAEAGDEPLPTVVDIHGGPLGCWAPAPHVEVVMLTSAGYRVVLPNIRGSTGYGAAWIRPQLGDWGGVDAVDVHAAVDHVIERGLADADRLGVLGLSYGGFLVNWLVGTTGRFAAAVSENGVSNQVSTWANSDSGPEYCRMAMMGDPLSADGVDRLWRQSPLRNVAAVHTPLLMLQAESDLRCPAHDNEQFFVALRQLGRAVEYVLYPDEFHVFAAAGRPDRRIDRMQRVVDWFDRYLSSKPTSTSATSGTRRSRS